MKPAPFAYFRAQTLDDVFEVLADRGDGARILAGGQSLMATLNMRLSAPDVLVDIGRVEGLAGIEDAGDSLRIGAMTRHVDVESSALIATHAPLIASAMPHVAHPAVRNRGTFGGSIAFADPAAELPACAVALEARMRIAGRNGARTVDADAFFGGLYETAIGPGEVLVSVEVPRIAAGWQIGLPGVRAPARGLRDHRPRGARPGRRRQVRHAEGWSSSVPGIGRYPPSAPPRCSKARSGRMRWPASSPKH